MGRSDSQKSPNIPKTTTISRTIHRPVYWDVKDSDVKAYIQKTNEFHDQWKAKIQKQQDEEQSQSTLQSIQSKKERLLLDAAIDCLAKTKGSKSELKSNLHYPHDAMEHFLDIRKKLAPWAQHPNHLPHEGPGYEGPWIENRWITYMEEQLWSLTEDTKSSENDDDNDSFLSLESIFGPYIPLLIPWTDLWSDHSYAYPKELYMTLLLECLRPNVVYITVVQNADGFPANQELWHHLQSQFNIVILSAGGYGHVPIPLLKQLEPLLQQSSEQQQLSSPSRIVMTERKHLMSYVGSRRNAPKDMRNEMLSQVSQNGKVKPYYYYGSEWKRVMADSKVSLCPRGFGRTSYHVMEAFQMGLIPIQVYSDNDQPWMPYGAFLQNVSFQTNLEGFPTLMEELSQLSDEHFENMEREIAKLRDDYFTYKGVLKQIHGFLLMEYRNDDIQEIHHSIHEKQPSTRLVCQALPENPATDRETFFTQE